MDDKVPMHGMPGSQITLGESLERVEIDDLIITETAHEPNRVLPWHCHAHANVAFVLNGSFTEVVERRRFECTPDSVIVKPPGEAHANTYGPSGMHGLVIEVRHHRLESLYPVSNALSTVAHIRRPVLSMLGLQIYREMRIMDRASLLAIEALSLQVIAELSRCPDVVAERRIPHWLAQAGDILHEHSSEAISLGYVARAVGVHPVHLAREFRRFYGCTLGEYLRRLRVQSACRRLATTSMPLAAVALAAGFSHQSHFSRLFKRYVGVTPTEFRSHCRMRR